MNFNEFEIGQIVEDNFGNRYEVTGVTHNRDYQPVRLLCTKRSKDKSYITRPYNSYYEFRDGCEWWITKDELKDFSIA